MRLLPLIVGLAIAAIASPTQACVELLNQKSFALAFEEADLVVDVRALKEDYVAVDHTDSLRVGVGIGEVREVHKGKVAGNEIAYRLVDGEMDGSSCPGRRFARPGTTYRLYLKYVADGGPPIIIVPTDVPSPMK